MQSRNFIKLFILLGCGALTLAVSHNDLMLKYCCKLKTFISDNIWYKCPLLEIGDNKALRFCQMECVANLFGFSNRKNLDYPKIDALVAGLKPTGGQSSVDLHRNTVDYCKTVTEYQMVKNITFEEKSECSPEFSYFVMCFVLKINDFCPQEHKSPSYECKSQKGLLDSMIKLIDGVHKNGVSPTN